MKWIFLMLVAFIAGAICSLLFFKRDDELKKLQSQLEKVRLYYRIANMWLEMRQKGKTAATYLNKKGIKRIAIYGMKELGERFYEEMKNTDIEVVCVIDQNPSRVIGDFTVISPDDEIPQVDAVIVTADYYYRQIVNKLRNKVNCPIYSLNGVIGNSFGRNL